MLRLRTGRRAGDRAVPGSARRRHAGRGMMVDLIIPTIARDSLVELLLALRDQAGPLPDNIYLVDDRRRADQPLIERGVELGRLNGRTHALRSDGRGPAAARNVGWRTSRAEWVAFLD